MRAFAYFFVHSFINSFLKLFRSVVVWIVICTIGVSMAAGATVSVVIFVAEGIFIASQPDAGGEEQSPVEETDAPEDDGEEEAQEEDALFGFSLATELDDIKNVLDILFTVAILGLGLLFVYTGVKAGVNLFSMADINFMFTAPFRPQSVLLFRMAGSMLSFLFIGLYMGLVMPASLLGMGIGMGQILTAVFVYVLVLLGGQMISLLTYMIGASYEGVKDKIKPAVIVVIALLAALFILLMKKTGMGYYETAVRVFTPVWTRFLPWFGWLKGILAAAMYHEYWMVLLFSVLSVASIAGFVWLAVRFPADFYEDAFEMAEKRQAVMIAQEEPKEIVKRAKNRGRLYHRGGIRHGGGANIFFFKAMYLRRRISVFGMITLNMLLLAVVLVGGAYLLRAFPKLAVYIYLLGVLVYELIRNFGNPISMDIQRPYIYLIPEGSFSKLMYCMLGNLASFLCDLLPGFLLAAYILKMEPLVGAGCCLATCALDFFCANTGLLVDMLIPESIPQKLKSSIQSALKFVPMFPTVLLVSFLMFLKMEVGLFLLFGICGVLGGLMMYLSGRRMGENQ